MKKERQPDLFSQPTQQQVKQVVVLQRRLFDDKIDILVDGKLEKSEITEQEATKFDIVKQEAPKKKKKVVPRKINKDGIIYSIDVIVKIDNCQKRIEKIPYRPIFSDPNLDDYFCRRLLRHLKKDIKEKNFKVIEIIKNKKLGKCEEIALKEDKKVRQ